MYLLRWCAFEIKTAIYSLDEAHFHLNSRAIEIKIAEVSRKKGVF